MPYPIEDKLVIAVASSALFDLSESDHVFRTQVGISIFDRLQNSDNFLWICVFLIDPQNSGHSSIDHMRSNHDITDPELLYLFEIFNHVGITLNISPLNPDGWVEHRIKDSL